MNPRTRNRWSIVLLFIMATVMATGCWKECVTNRADAYDKFEIVRAAIQSWLSEVRADKVLVSASTLKETIVDDWARQKDRYQIVSVRKPDDYTTAGHIPHAVNIYWVDIVTDESLERLDPQKTLILYCYYGHGSMLSCTILDLLGYKCRSLGFGMMGWNLDALVKEPWDQRADYEVESTVNESKGAFSPPVIASDQGDALGIIKKMAREYLSQEGSPVITASDTKAIIDDWDRRNLEYQVVDVRSKRDYEAGHVPHSINIPWEKIAERGNLRKLDPKKIVIICSENGQTGQLATTVLGLLGYRAVDMKFGMMDWNRSNVDGSELWGGAAQYPIELSTQGVEPR